MSEISENSPVYDKKNPFLACLRENRLLSKEGSIKDTRHFVVDIAGSGLVYTCGDSLGVYPTNNSECVQELLDALGASGEEMVRLPKDEEDISLREALSHRLSLAQPTKKIMKALLESGVDGETKSALEAKLVPENNESTKEYLENREFADLLLDFPGARLSPQEFIVNLRKLMPRLYSIASSPTVYPSDVHLTIAVVRYHTNGRDRLGVCSTFLAERAPLAESIVPVFVAKSHFGLPEDDSADLIMVGPGTGIAPFRAFLQERIARGGSGRSWVFFGDQHHDTDYLYGEEFEKYLAEGQLDRLDLAWSRDQDYKIYVQDKLLENAAEVWKWLQGGAYFYVCGDAKRMAKDVNAALHKIAQEHGGMSEEEAIAWVKALKKEKRYQRDVY